MLDDKTFGLILALSSSFLIGTSFIITKKALIASREGGIQQNYLKSYLWWIGMLTMISGEVANFAAYSYAPAILVTPLGAGSVLLSAVLANFFLNEKLGIQGTIGCALCIIGSIVIILHSPGEKDIKSVDEILNYAVKPGISMLTQAFFSYMLFVSCVSLYLIFVVAPKYGKDNMLIYVTISSLLGSISVMAVKGFGIALKLTSSGNNQFVHLSTYIFLIVVVFCAITQTAYFNKALDLFSTNRVTPIYYVFFTTATIIASFLLFQGFNDTSGVNIATVFCGFATIFIGVFQLNNNEEKPNHLDTHMELQCLDTDEESTSSTYHPSPNQKAIFNAFDEEEEV